MARSGAGNMMPLLLLAFSLLVSSTSGAQAGLSGPDIHISQQVSARRRLTQAASPPPAAANASDVPYAAQLNSLLAELGPGRPVTLKNVEAARFLSYAQAGAQASPGKPVVQDVMHESKLTRLLGPMHCQM